MPSRRELIEMTPEELAGFLDAGKTLICATNGRNGWPHLMPLWYVMRGREPWAWTYAKSQKTRNLERDPRATVQVEAGEQYDQLRGVMFECNVELIRDTDAIRELGLELFSRYTGGVELPAEITAMVEQQAPKRIAMRFEPVRTVSWDHRKLGGTY